ncbi:hypothetical protein EDB87DRAFT_1831310 [Lactarius vividus]|nr:hypothetical protein EDB87DRAFT_1831310 [Lactarius vividus]
MSNSVPPTQLPPQPPPPPPPGFTQSQASVLGPGIAGLFIQGIESGLVITQFSQWFAALDRSESSVITTVVIFVTVVGLAQSGISFASAWSKYVKHFGMFLLPAWEDNVHSIPTLVIAVPVQGFDDSTLLLLLDLILSGICASSTSPVTLASRAHGLNLSPQVLHYLTRTMRQVYTPHTRRRISRLVNIVWQSALPPTLCAVCLSALYIQYATSPQKRLQLWMPVIQQMIGKLYVLSLFYIINARPLRPDERLTTIISTLTVPADSVYTFTREARGRDVDVPCSDIAVERGTARTVDFAV